MKEKLKQMRYINSEIMTIETQIAYLKPLNSMDKVKGSTPEFPYTAASFQISGVDIEDYNRRVRRLKSKLVKKKDELLKLQEETQKFIDKIEDSFVRQIITLRYSEGLSWNDIAAKMGNNYSKDSLRKTSERFLKKF